MKPFLQGHPLEDSLAFRSSVGVSLWDTSVKHHWERIKEENSFLGTFLKMFIFT